MTSGKLKSASPSWCMRAGGSQPGWIWLQAQHFLFDAQSTLKAANFNCHRPAYARLYWVGRYQPGELFFRIAKNSSWMRKAAKLTLLSNKHGVRLSTVSPHHCRSLLLVRSEDGLLNSVVFPPIYGIQFQFFFV